MLTIPVTRDSLRFDIHYHPITIADLDYVRDEHPYLFATSRLIPAAYSDLLENKLEQIFKSVVDKRLLGITGALRDADIIFREAKKAGFNLTKIHEDQFNRIAGAALHDYEASTKILEYLRQIKDPGFDYSKHESLISCAIPDLGYRHAESLLRTAYRKAKRLKKCSRNGSTPFNQMLDVLKEAAPLSGYNAKYNEKVKKIIRKAFSNGVESVREKAREYKRYDPDKYRHLKSIADNNERNLKRYTHA
ncbi:MAG: hypothetical protein L0Y62_03025 [Nitrospirae bacterium]|nr:hypothetical protein [Nitrospirota bacterium]